MNSTPAYLISAVVVTLAFLSLLYVGTLSWCVIHSIAVDPVLQTAFSAVGGGIVGTFTGMLINTRSTPPDQKERVTIATETPAPASPDPLPEPKKD